MSFKHQADTLKKKGGGGFPNPMHLTIIWRVMYLTIFRGKKRRNFGKYYYKIVNSLTSLLKKVLKKRSYLMLKMQ